MDAAPKTKGHVKALMHRLYEKAMCGRWSSGSGIRCNWSRSKGSVTPEEANRPHRRAVLPNPRTAAAALPHDGGGGAVHGLRAEEVLALEWQDIDFENLSMRVVRAVVHGRVKIVKTEYSEDDLPLDPDFAAILLDWKYKSEEENRKVLAREKPHLWGQSWSSPARSPGDTTTRPCSAGLYPSGWMLSGGVSKLRGGCRQLV